MPQGDWVIDVDGTRVGSPPPQPTADRDPVLDSGHGLERRRPDPLERPMDPALVVRTAVLVLIAYLAGSIPWACWSARFSGGTDPRTIGSGRTGGTNALRALGPQAGRRSS